MMMKRTDGFSQIEKHVSTTNVEKCDVAPISYSRQVADQSVYLRSVNVSRVAFKAQAFLLFPSK